MKIEFFELYATYIWPLVRPLVKLSPRCKRCLLNDRATTLKDGVCQECSSYVPAPAAKTIEVTQNQKNEFNLYMESLVSTNAYDCIYLLSGGKDSAYVLHRLRHEFPSLKILAITVNNGFMSPVAIANAEKAALKLKTDWILCNSRIDDFKVALRAAFLGLNNQGCSGVVDFTDGSMIFETGKKVAADMGITTILSGMSWVQVQRIVGQQHFKLVNPAGQSEIFPLAVWRTDEQEIRARVREWDLMLPNSDSPLVSNSTLITAMAVLDLKNLGYSSFEPEFAQMIREGKTDRKVWLPIFQLLEFATARNLLDKDLFQTLEQLNLKLSDVTKNVGKK
jgi:3'-phosphoadenosine 5'-phosphosulfate sulfotransferase (PAPS reductase)/FAD synthetase